MIKKTIAIVSTTIERGGAENFLIQVAIYLAKNSSYRILIIGFQGEPHHLFQLEENGVIVRHYGTERKTRSIFKMFGVFALYLKDIVKFRPSIIIANLQPAEVMVAFGSIFYKRAKNKLIRHNDEFGWGLKFIRMIVASRFHGYAAISKVCAQKLETELVKKSRISILHYGVEKNYNRKINKKGFLITKGKNIINVAVLARLEPQKNHIFLFQSINRINTFFRRKGKQIIFHLAGSGGLSEKLLSYVGDLDLDGKIIFYGKIKDANSFLSSCDLSLLVSKYEGLGLVGLESLRLGKCFVAPRIEPFIELYEKKNNSGVFLYEEENVESLCENINLGSLFNEAYLPKNFEIKMAYKRWSNFIIEKD